MLIRFLAESQMRRLIPLSIEARCSSLFPISFMLVLAPTSLRDRHKSGIDLFIYLSERKQIGLIPSKIPIP